MSAQDECSGGVRVEVAATRDVGGQQAPHASADHPLGPSGILTIPIVCRRDDYMLLPPTALGGVPCLSIPSQDRFDPYPLAVRMAAELPPPDLHIMMNPARGMVRVPTWFWVEGYDGGTLSQSETVRESHENCRLVPVRGSDGLPVLGADGRPLTRRDCTIENSTFVVSVRLWPNHFAWDFGDQHQQDIPCIGQGDCSDALGAPFIDALHPSPIQHPYVWSSLGVNGAADAYTINLAITFAAQYDVTVDGRDLGGWRSLPARTLTWTTSHQVQEAQAVLTRPCPVTLPRC